MESEPHQDRIRTGEEDENHTPVVKLHNLGESSLDIVVRAWTTNDEYWNIHWYLTREVKLRFDAAGISIPFPQHDLHIKSQPPA